MGFDQFGLNVCSNRICGQSVKSPGYINVETEDRPPQSARQLLLFESKYKI